MACLSKLTQCNKQMLAKSAKNNTKPKLKITVLRKFDWKWQFYHISLSVEVPVVPPVGRRCPLCLLLLLHYHSRV